MALECKSPTRWNNTSKPIGHFCGTMRHWGCRWPMGFGALLNSLKLAWGGIFSPYCLWPRDMLCVTRAAAVINRCFGNKERVPSRKGPTYMGRGHDTESLSPYYGPINLRSPWLLKARSTGAFSGRADRLSQVSQLCVACEGGWPRL